VTSQLSLLTETPIEPDPLAFEDRGVVYTVSLDLSEQDWEAIVLRGNIPASVDQQLLSVETLTLLISTRLRMQLTVAQNQRRHAEKARYR